MYQSPTLKTEPEITSKEHLVDIAVLSVAVALVYGRLAGYGFLFNLDDNLYVLSNETIRGFTWKHLGDAFAMGSIGQYNPLALLSYMLDYTLWGMWPGGYHLSNIVLHGLNSVMVYRLMGRWYGSRGASLVAALIFAVHPVQVETVAWISARKDLLAMLLFLVSWEWYCRYRETPSGRTVGFYLLSLTAFVLSLLAKPLAVVMPPLLILFDICFYGMKPRKTLLDKIPFVIAAAVFSVIVLYSESPQHGGGRMGYHGGSPLATLYTMLPVFVSYLGMLVWPAGLSVEYWPQVHRSIDANVAVSSLVLAGVAYGSVRLFRSDKRSGFWLMYFWIGLLPVSQIVPLLLIKFDHYLYLPLLGGAALVGCGVAYLGTRLDARFAKLVFSLVAIWLLSLSAVSSIRCAVWKDALTVWSDASQKTPQSYRVWYLLGEAYLGAGRKADAVRSFERSLQINPTSTDVYLALGDLYTAMGKPEAGFACYKKLLEINPKYIKGWAALGTYYLNSGNYIQADAMFARALALQPDALQVVTMRGALALKEGNLDGARALLLQVEASGWGSPENAYVLACVESSAGHESLALEWMDEALRRGYRHYDKFARNPELSGLWKHHRYIQLMQQYFPGEPTRDQ